MASQPRVAVQGSVNERLVAIEIVRQVLLLRYSIHVRDMVVKALNDTEHPIAGAIRDSLTMDPGLRDPAQVRKLEDLIARLNAMRAPAWQASRDAAISELYNLEADEPKEQDAMLAFLVPGIVLTTPLIAGQAVNAPFQGRTVQQWFADLQSDDAKRIRTAIYAGVQAGEDAATVARRVVGSTVRNGTDGTTQTSRNYVDTIVRSAITSTAAQARDLFYRANPATLSQEQFVAVLDGVTTQLCRGLDGDRYPVGEGPIPPLHLNCRSMRVVVLPESIGGPIHEPEVYAAWIRKQPKAVTVELLGATRAARVAKGQVDAGAFVDYGSRPMTLAQIRAAARRLMGAYS